MLKKPPPSVMLNKRRVKKGPVEKEMYLAGRF